jgi:lysozyme
MTDPQIRQFRLAKGRPDGINPYLTDAGAFLGNGAPLLDRIGTQWRPRRIAGLADRADSLATIAKALNRGDRSLAAIALVQAEFPPLSGEIWGKYAPDYEEPRVPAGNGRQSGEWTTGAQSPSTMSISDAGMKFIERHEGKGGKFAPQEYRGKDKKNRTIGFGRKLSPQSFFPDGISQSDAEVMLTDDIATAEHTVQTSVKVPLTQQQYDALVSLAYNIGSGNFRGSKLLGNLNAGDYAGAANQFTDWSYSEGQWVQGLNNRRKDEQALFGGGKQ